MNIIPTLIPASRGTRRSTPLGAVAIAGLLGRPREMTILERRRHRIAVREHERARRFSDAVAAAGFFGPQVAHERGGHDGRWSDPDCPLCQQEAA